MQKIDFLKNTLRNLRTTGTITRSSKYLSKTMLSYIQFDKAKTIVELGPGDGIFTRYILKKMKADSRLIAFEINEDFLEHLKLSIEDPSFELVSDSAEHMTEILRTKGVETADYIISGMPFTILPDDLVQVIIKSCYDLLKPGGKFIQFHYALSNRKLYTDTFKNIQIKFVALNVPPAFVMVCEKR